MIQIIPSEKRHFTDLGWLKTYWLFSFSDYFDKENTHHGTLRVFNDDIVLPQTGFGTHPHEEMEIVSIVLDGEMQHHDTMGNKTIIRKNDVQRMTAGTGLQHSEWNHGDEPVKFFQIWILPDQKGLQPSYDQKSISPALWKNNLYLLASENGREDVVSLNTDANLYRAELHENNTISFQAGQDRNLFLYVVEGSVKVNGHDVKKRDQARIDNEKSLQISTDESADFILIDIPITNH
jgi:redox-sensitive bicupin YhaK (pirin superfamily)